MISCLIHRWNIQQGISVIPKSSSVSRISENVNIFDFELSAEDMSVINAFNKNIRFNDPGNAFRMLVYLTYNIFRSCILPRHGCHRTNL